MPVMRRKQMKKCAICVMQKVSVIPVQALEGCRRHLWCTGPHTHAAFQLQRQQAAQVLTLLTSSVGAQAGLLSLPSLLLVVAVVLL